MLAAVVLGWGIAAAAAQPALELQTAAGSVKIEAWGANALRVRAVVVGGGAVQEGLPGALIKPGSDNKGAPLAGGVDTPAVAVSAERLSVTNGNIAATVGTDGLVTVTRVSDGAVVLKELARELLPPPPAPPPPPPGLVKTMTIALNNSAAHCKTGQDSAGRGPCCLDVNMWNKGNNAAVAASNCHYDPSGFGGKGFLNQRWTIGAEGSIVVALDGKCLTASSASSITVSTCQAGKASQKWVAKAGVGPIQTSWPSGFHDGRCLTQDAEAGCGAGYTLAACDSGNKLQEWTIEL